MRGDDLEERKNIQDKLIAKFDREAEPKPFEYQGKGFIAGYKILQRLYLNGSKYHEQKKLHEEYTEKLKFWKHLGLFKRSSYYSGRSTLNNSEKQSLGIWEEEIKSELPRLMKRCVDYELERVKTRGAGNHFQTTYGASYGGGVSKYGGKYEESKEATYSGHYPKDYSRPSKQVPITTSPRGKEVLSQTISKEKDLSTVIISNKILEEFIRLSKSNTRIHVETCGILCGTGHPQEGFVARSLLIPQQEGSYDTCQMFNEVEIYEFATKNEYIILGWIHTHPTFDCFLSAVDLHTHYPYQKLLREAIAIVYSPVDTKVSMQSYRIKDDYMDLIGKCPHRGFHKHIVNDELIYERTSHHIVIDEVQNEITSKIHDLR